MDIITEAQKASMTGLLQYCNLIVKLALEKKEFYQIGKLPKFFLPSEKKEIKSQNLQMWPGFEVATKSVVHGIFLNVDCATKFI